MRRGLVKQILLFLGNYIIEQAGNTRLQGFILFPENSAFVRPFFLPLRVCTSNV